MKALTLILIVMPFLYGCQPAAGSPRANHMAEAVFQAMHDAGLRMQQQAAAMRPVYCNTIGFTTTCN